MQLLFPVLLFVFSVDIYKSVTIRSVSGQTPIVYLLELLRVTCLISICRISNSCFLASCHIILSQSSRCIRTSGIHVHHIDIIVHIVYYQ